MKKITTMLLVLLLGILIPKTSVGDSNDELVKTEHISSTEQAIFLYHYENFF